MPVPHKNFGTLRLEKKYNKSTRNILEQFQNKANSKSAY